MMLEMIAKNQKGNEGDFGVISLEGLEALTQKGLNEEYVISSNEKLTKDYKHVVVSYGFQDFHSLYLFAKSNTENEVVKYDSGAPKDYSSMSKVRRTVVRDGRRTAVTFYEKPRGVDNKYKGRTTKGPEGKSPELSPVSELNILAQGTREEPIPIKELHAINKMMEGFIVVGEFEDLDRIKLYLDEEMFPKAIQGLRVEGEYLTMPFYATNGAVQGFYQRAFFELIKVALNWELGIKLEKDDTKIQEILAETSGMEDIDGVYLSAYEELLEAYGEMP